MALTTFTPIPAFIINLPTGDNVLVGQTATFTAQANGDPKPTYQWLIRTNVPDFTLPNGTKIDASELTDGRPYYGTHSPTLTVQNTTLKMNGEEFVCVVGNGYEGPTSLLTNWVDLQVWKPTPLILKQPSSVVAPPGVIVTFRVELNTDLLTNIQWQILTPSALGWQPLKDDLLYTGVNDRTLTINLTSPAMSGYQYRCVVDDGTGLPAQYSSVATLTVKK